ncbi:dTDP-glucose 4,6-dehydratase [Streptomyces sp. N2-109]|uniref:dTDP-glucose 4,6-dehydratase n=1 Tax=Streptomyces gossypii TaxID=2883101 RepID=A0ABT2JP01_9ACTN|nr:dTDP-glucose 4,6-dehydratase [Streptomyces gossypii]MCT2589612.1 dTDP-glucose 4,6-dehydratase [Streptomyces gossypii]
MKILVTGGAGFIGSHYVRRLLAAGDSPVTVLDKLTYAGNRANLPESDSRLTFVEGDITDTSLLADLLPGHDAVVHFAAESHVDRSLQGASDFVLTNVLGSQTVFDACLRAGIERVVHVSTDEVYGSIPKGSSVEEDPLLPNSPYAASKAGSDLLARSYFRSHGLPVMVTRCSNNYGPYQHPEKVIPLFVTRLLTGGRVPLYGDGLNVRHWLHVDDHCRALQLVLEQGTPGQIYNIGGGPELSNVELTGRLLELCGADESQIEYVADRKAHDLRYSVDYSKIESELGYRPLKPFDDGIAEVVDWYRENRWWWDPAAGTVGGPSAGSAPLPTHQPN